MRPTDSPPDRLGDGHYLCPDRYGTTTVRPAAAGGLGFLLGDGKLKYGRENILESYYTVHAWRGIYLAPGVQYVVNPGYNRDRGPVVVPSFRAHIEF